MFTAIRNVIEGLFGRRRKFVQYIAPASADKVFDDYIARQVAYVAKCDSAADLARMGANSSGYVREAVIKRCVELRDPALLPLVAARLNDWVKNVREAARRAMETLLPLMPASALLEALRTVLDLARMSRTDHSQWQARYENLLVQTLSAEDFVEGVQSGDMRTARACFAILARHRLVAPGRLVAIGMAASEDIVLAQQALGCFERLPEDQREPLYIAAMRSPFGAIRASALRFVLARETEENREAIAMDALFDKHWSARALAATYLRASGFDLRGYYRDVLLNPSAHTAHVQIALMALAGAKDASDLVLIKGFIEAQVPAVRRTALAAWLMLKPDDKDLIAVEGLRDASPAVRRFAGHVIQRRGAYVPLDVIRSHLARHGDWARLLSLSQVNKWDWLESIVLAAIDIESNRLDMGSLRSSLRSWRVCAGSRYESPTVRQVEFLRSSPAQLALCQLIDEVRMPVPFLEMELGGW